MDTKKKLSKLTSLKCANYEILLKEVKTQPSQRMITMQSNNQTYSRYVRLQTTPSSQRTQQKIFRSSYVVPKSDNQYNKLYRSMFAIKSLRTLTAYTKY